LNSSDAFVTAVEQPPYLAYVGNFNSPAANDSWPIDNYNIMGEILRTGWPMFRSPSFTEPTRAFGLMSHQMIEAKGSGRLVQQRNEDQRKLSHRILMSRE
jgi:hypothetical protein